MNELGILVVIPYYAAGAQGNELELAAEGWIRHFKHPFSLMIIGDFDEAVLRIVMRHPDDVVFIICPRVEPVQGQYTPHLDHVNKFMKVMELFPKAGIFIYSCDDIYAVKDFTLSDVLVPKVSSKEIPPIDYRREKDWFRDLGKTRELCVKKGWPTMNWVCHLPVAYWSSDLRDAIRLYNMRRKSYVMENVIFNHLHAAQRMLDIEEEPVLVPETGGPWKYGVQTSSPDFTAVEETGAVWITNSNCGWSPRLEEILRRHYGL